VLERCDRVLLPDGKVVPMSKEARAAIGGAVDRLAAGALRCLALARKGGDKELGELAEYSGEGHRGHKALQARRRGAAQCGGGTGFFAGGRRSVHRLPPQTRPSSNH